MRSIQIQLLTYCLVLVCVRSVAAAAPALSEEIRIAQESLQANPKDITACNRLATLYIQMMRSTADTSYAAKAQELLNGALKIQPDHYESLTNLGLVLMSQHRFIEARDTARKATRINPGNAIAFGILGDALYELGDYNECAQVYQKMMDLHPGSAAYGRAAYYRRLTGDLEGANQLLMSALKLTDVQDQENRAWFLYQMGLNFFLQGRLKEAAQCEEASLQIFPGYYNALATLGKISAAKGNRQEAIRFYEQAIAVVPMPDFVASLGDLYALAGRKQDAEQQYQLVEYIGRISSINREIYNRQLALFYADHGRKLDVALDLTKHEIDTRKDVYGYDALAWCLYRNHQNAAALTAIQKALRMNTQDPMLLFHAGMIHQAAGKKQQAKSYLQQAIKLNPNFHPVFASAASQALKTLQTRQEGL